MFLLSLFVLFVQGNLIFLNFTEHQECKNVNRTLLLSCFSNFDANNDGNLSINEIDAGFTAVNFNYPLLTSQQLFDLCDVNMDGVLNMLDWNRYNSCCKDLISITYTCNVCYRTGWTISHK